jgi:glyoxylase-like metal-dependent hydrolase (beta-lactamase superfamily II)
MGNHLCLDDGERLWTGDHAMGFATSLVSPPEGDMDDYMASLRRLLALGPRSLWPGHGEPVADGAARLRDLLAHRLARAPPRATCWRICCTSRGTAGWRSWAPRPRAPPSAASERDPSGRRTSPLL